jgi:nucleotide-binding universal stress UspA family protein
MDMEGHMRILLAIDDSECSTAAVKAVIDQFTPAHTQITVLHADDWPEGMPPPMAFAEGSSAARSVLAFHKLRRSNAAALLESVAEQLRRAGFAAAASLRDGNPQHTIVQCAKEWHADLIVLGSHGKKGLDRMLGSVSDSVAKHAPCSVEIDRAGSPAA